MKKTRLSAEERKAAIVRAALPLFARKGYAETTTKELARAAGVSEPLLYRHFPSKEALYIEIQNLMCQSSAPSTRKFVQLTKELEPSTDTLVKLVYYVVSIQILGKPNTGIESATPPSLMLNSFLEDGLFARLMYQNRFACFCARIEECLQIAVAAGDAEESLIPAANTARFGHHLAAWIALVHLPPQPAIGYAESREELVHQAVLFTLRGMGLKRSAIKKHFDPEALNEFFES